MMLMNSAASSRRVPYEDCPGVGYVDTLHESIISYDPQGMHRP
jgi:hypothetical protein